MRQFALLLLLFLAPLLRAEPERQTASMPAVESCKSDLQQIAGVVKPQELVSRVSAYLTNRFPDAKLHEVLGRGTTSQAIAMGKYVVIVPANVHLSETADEYRNTVTVYEEIRKLAPEKQRYFAKLIDAHIDYDPTSRSDVPALVFERATEGTLTMNLSNPSVAGIKADFSTLHKTSLAVAKAVDALHQAGYVHGDIKPDNLYVTRRKWDLEILLGDVGSAKPKNDKIKTGTPFYLPTITSPLHPQFALSNQGRDAWALRKVRQEILLGKPINQLPREFTVEGEVSADFKSLTTVDLKYSPYTIDKRVPPTLSVLSWVIPRTPAEDVTNLEKVATYEHEPVRFFSQYLGPQVLNRMPYRQLAYLIFYGDELKEPYLRGALGLSATTLSGIRPYMEEFEAETLRARQRQHAPTSPIAHPNDETQSQSPAAPPQ